MRICDLSTTVQEAELCKTRKLMISLVSRKLMSTLLFIYRTQTTLRHTLGSRVLQDCIENREAIASEVLEIIEEPASLWGVKVRKTPAYKYISQLYYLLYTDMAMHLPTSLSDRKHLDQRYTILKLTPRITFLSCTSTTYWTI